MSQFVLNMHDEMLLEEYRQQQSLFLQLQKVVMEKLATWCARAVLS